ncbi:nuclear pore complex protein Nup153-like [Ptychodera flava]|uniref:nuclear pore complex protein Nup153-like n=1 Tax=Ptychodera flava TaxID=63121 RepID=UPI00396A5CCC
METQHNVNASEERRALHRSYSEDLFLWKNKKSKDEFLKRVLSFLEHVFHQDKFTILILMDHLSDNSHDGTNFAKIADAFQHLEKYVYNLLTARWRTKYEVIKEQTGFYKCKIEPHIKNVGVIWQRMGYNKRGTNWILDRHRLITDDLVVLAVDLLTASEECKIMKELCDKVKVYQFGNPAQLALEARISCRGTVDDCFTWLAGLHMHHPPFGDSNLRADAVEKSNVMIYSENDDDEHDLYSPGPTAGKSALTQDEHIEASMMVLFPHHTTDKNERSGRLHPSAAPRPPDRKDSSFKYLTDSQHHSWQSGTRDYTINNPVLPELRQVSRLPSGASSGYTSLHVSPTAPPSRVRDSFTDVVRPSKKSPTEGVYTPYENLQAIPAKSDRIKGKATQSNLSNPSNKESLTGSSGIASLSKAEYSANKSKNLKHDSKISDNSQQSGKTRKSEVKIASGSSASSTGVGGTSSRARPLSTLSSINQWTCIKCAHYNMKTDATCRNCSTPRLTLHEDSGMSSHTSKDARDEGKSQKQSERVNPNKELVKSGSERKLGTWECPHCTVVNDTVSNVCETCGKSKDFDSAEGSKETKSTRECPRCTFINIKYAHRCKSCDMLLTSETSV